MIQARLQQIASYNDSLPALLLLLLVPVIAHVARVYWSLSHIPGPFWARVTNIQRVYWVKKARSHEIHADLHRRYGNLVRLGPNMVAISDPKWIPVIYPIRAGFPKGNFYRTLMPYSRQGSALPLVFNTRDEVLHTRLKKPIASMFSLSNVLTLECFVDRTISELFLQFDRRFARDQPVSFDMGDWLQFFAFEDSEGLLGAIWNFMKTAAPVTQIPWFDILWYKNSIVTLWRPATGMPILKIVSDSVSQRREKLEKNELSADDVTREDFLSRFLDVQSKDPSIHPWSVTSWTFSNVIVGSDSTAVVMKTLWYNLLSHPVSKDRLYIELSQAHQQAKISSPYPAWSEISALPYLDACVSEAIRLHPPFCLPLERVVPPEGINIDGQFLPGRTVVGINPWVANHYRPTFGEDADHWRPERWLVDQEQYRVMERSVLTFGAGRRICLGRNVALLELKKLTAAILLSYDVQILDPAAYKVENRWFFRQWGVQVQVRRRTEWSQMKTR
ncbi:uncharacterized protein N7498_004457 [Penicillium cinerascens]|uniref:Cytochrome P450 n=1 Tax=Penicillium cinerascens TaxID=70096 RepID=A0A9W9T837_9EURO|nr:uncharacterized protein N7498_004457 [Penicillium cinerascens]KAJ5212811.1 hypothetical protein N7498_004457 [Penicillium cinerascens]